MCCRDWRQMGIYLVVSLSHISILPSQLCRQPHTLATTQYLIEKKGLFLGFWNQQAKHLINILLTLVAKFILKTSCNTTWGWGKYLGWNLGRLMRLLKRFCNCFVFRRRKAVLNILRFVSLTIKSVRCAKRELNIFAESFHNIWV